MKNWILTHDEPTFDSGAFVDATRSQDGQRLDDPWRRCSMFHIPEELQAPLTARLRRALDAYKMKFDSLGNVNFVTHVEPPTIIRYDAATADKFNAHVDCWNVPSSLRQVSIILYLNDVEEGGETVMTDHDVVVRPVAGRCLVFPAFYTHPHKALPPISGSKYVVIAWLTFPPLPAPPYGPPIPF